ncbi:ATP-grasp domain-containing protein [Streptomyces sp. cg35]|uniref:ATP-grasp domain-containing protein n=1 Tax=Streptomyces sp. cg35 TaxID=3421650 RepID=UPI003D17F003
MSTPRTLFLSPRLTDTGQALAGAARRRGLHVETLTAWRTPDVLRGCPGASLYAGPLFADAVSRELGLGLLEAAPGWLAGLPRELTRRDIELTTVAAARGLRRPAFVKPPTTRASRPASTRTAVGCRARTRSTTPHRCWSATSWPSTWSTGCSCSTGRCAPRAGTRGALAVVPLDDDPLRGEVLTFAARLPAAQLPSAVVVDVGRLAHDGGWAVVEANAAWASGHYACDPDAALDVVLRAACPAGSVGRRDTRFLRASPPRVG